MRATIVRDSDGLPVYYGRDHAAKLAALGAGHSVVDSRRPSDLHVWDGSAWVESAALIAARDAEQTATAREQAIAAIAKRRVRITLAHNEAIRLLAMGVPHADWPNWVKNTISALHDIAINPDLRPGDE